MRMANILKTRRVAYLLTILVVTAIVAGAYLQIDGKTRQTQILGAIVAMTISSLSALHDSERIGIARTPARWIAAKYFGVDLLFVLSRFPNWSLISDLGFFVSSTICVIALGFICQWAPRTSHRKALQNQPL